MKGLNVKGNKTRALKLQSNLTTFISRTFVGRPATIVSHNASLSVNTFNNESASIVGQCLDSIEVSQHANNRDNTIDDTN